MHSCRFTDEKRTVLVDSPRNESGGEKRIINFLFDLSLTSSKPIIAPGLQFFVRFPPCPMRFFCSFLSISSSRYYFGTRMQYRGRGGRGCWKTIGCAPRRRRVGRLLPGTILNVVDSYVYTPHKQYDDPRRRGTTKDARRVGRRRRRRRRRSSNTDRFFEPVASQWDHRAPKTVRQDRGALLR